ncbi:MAG: hypothetical protein PUC11_00085 [Elusimicrobia bacterium]|nr:hypothetical protein [Elusimicrobiota bacterium]
MAAEAAVVVCVAACTTSLEVVGYYRDASGQYHESYAEVTTCDGEM